MSVCKSACVKVTVCKSVCVCVFFLRTFSERIWRSLQLWYVTIAGSLCENLYSRSLRMPICHCLYREKEQWQLFSNATGIHWSLALRKRSGNLEKTCQWALHLGCCIRRNYPGAVAGKQWLPRSFNEHAHNFWWSWWTLAKKTMQARLARAAGVKRRWTVECSLQLRTKQQRFFFGGGFWVCGHFASWPSLSTYFFFNYGTLWRDQRACKRSGTL